jgi:hypothetical protein
MVSLVHKIVALSIMVVTNFGDIKMSERLLHRTWTIRTLSPFTVTWNVQNLRDIESSGTEFLRSLMIIETSEPIARDGTYVSMEWITLSESSRHLLLDVRIADELSASLVLCQAKMDTSSKEPSSNVDSFAFCMVQGERKIYEIMLRFLESVTGCVVGNKSFRPSPIHLARTLIEVMSFMDDTTSGQVDITFGMPRNVKSLDEFSLSIPRISFERFLIGLDFNRPKERRDIVPLQEDLTIHFFKAIRLFVLEIMHMDIDSFPIIRIANSILSIGGTGKLKILDKNNLHNILNYIEKITVAQISIESIKAGTKRKRLSNPTKNSSSGADQSFEVTSEEEHDENRESNLQETVQEQLENPLPLFPIKADYSGVEIHEL